MSRATDLAGLASNISGGALLPAAGGVPTGTVIAFVGASAPAGWVLAQGGTIGSAASGATARANADTAALYALLWAATANADLPIQNSNGTAGTRGADAAADFAANKRLPLPDLRGEFIRGLDGGRGVDTGRAMLSAQAGMVGPHTHPLASVSSRNTASGGSDTVAMNSTVASYATQNNSGTETRPRNIAMHYAIRL